ncbi:unnamed protein product [marine sediment metagenome]|uniref:Uncharacterized protein n=1 Tax=marine sediment metagenome TaxID=412755 RepID=X1ALX9_9ZZZZ
MKQTEITLEEAEKIFSAFSHQDYFIDAYFQNGLEGSSWDNIIELKLYWTKCKLIIDSQ